MNLVLDMQSLKHLLRLNRKVQQEIVTIIIRYRKKQGLNN